jgi:spore coat protein CotF
MLQEYADDIEDLRDAKKDLKKEGFSLPSLLNLFTRNTGKPHLLIREMRKACMYENHLIEIFAYKAKMEKLREMKATHPESATEIGKMMVNSVVVHNMDIMNSNIGNSINTSSLTKQQRIEALLRQEIDAAKEAKKTVKFILLPYKAAIEAGAISDTMTRDEFNSKYGCSVSKSSFTEWIRGTKDDDVFYESYEIDPLIEQFRIIIQS